MTRQQFIYVPFILLFASIGFAQSNSASASGDCNAPASDPIAYIDLQQGHPSGTAMTKDGCWVFVALPRPKLNSNSGIALLRRSGGRAKLEKVFAIQGSAIKMILTHDEKLLIVAGSDNVALMSVERMLSQKDDVVVSYLTDPIGRAGMRDVKATADDRFLFIASLAGIRMVDLERARNQKFSFDVLLGFIAVHPAAIALSPDEKLLYASTEIVPKAFGWKQECNGPTPGSQLRTEGAVTVIDVESVPRTFNAAAEPLNWIPAGCGPEEIALSPAGDILYVTVGDNDAVIAFDTKRMLSDPAHAAIKRVPAGKAPAGITLADAGKKIIVADSICRFWACFSQTKSQPGALTVIDARKISAEDPVLGILPVQGFPEKLSSSPDGRTLFLSNHDSNFLEIIDVASMPLISRQPSNSK